MGKLELLAPAGSWEALEAAVNAGADAVYLGGTAFGARAYAANFDREALRQAVRFAHLRRVRLFVTVNTLVDQGEREELASYLLWLRDIGADGIIVQDLGVVRLARQLVPELPLHASTQMTLTNSAAVAFAREAGIERSVLARELNLEEIRAACALGEDIECFIHGALCICYSGQCLLSSLIGGRSGNRGRCAQPCRLPYVLQDAAGRPQPLPPQTGPYLLSPKDLNTLDLLPQLIEAGVMSFKIEGRMKRPEYVAVVVDIYRRALDSYLAGHYQVSQEDRDNIQQIFNRDFTTAYLLERPGKALISSARPNNRGVLLGRVVSLGRGQAGVKLERELHLGDGLEFWVKVGGRQGTTVTALSVQGRQCDRAAAGEVATIPVPRGVGLGDRVFRTLDRVLADYAQGFFGSGAEKRLPLRAQVRAQLGQPLRLAYVDAEGNRGEGATSSPAQAALKRPLTEAAVYQQVGRLGTTPYQLEEADIQLEEGLMLPLSQLNQARRQAIEALEAARLASFPPLRAKYPPAGAPAPAPMARAVEGSHGCIINVHCDTVAKAEAALAAGAQRILFGGDCFNGRQPSRGDYEQVARLCRRQGRELALATPRIVKEGELAYYRQAFPEWARLGADYLYIENIGLWQLARQVGGPPLWCGRSLNLFNGDSLAFYAEAGAQGACLSCELNLEQLETLAAASSLPLEAVVQGRLELMVSEYCLPGAFLGEGNGNLCSQPCKQGLFLGDRKGAAFPLVGDQRCRMHLLNAYDLSLAAHVPRLQQAGLAVLTIDARCYSPEEAASFTALYREALAGAAPQDNLPGTTRGHFFRGVV